MSGRRWWSAIWRSAFSGAITFLALECVAGMLRSLLLYALGAAVANWSRPYGLALSATGGVAAFVLTFWREYHRDVSSPSARGPMASGSRDA